MNAQRNHSDAIGKYSRKKQRATQEEMTGSAGKLKTLENLPGRN